MTRAELAAIADRIESVFPGEAARLRAAKMPGPKKIVGLKPHTDWNLKLADAYEKYHRLVASGMDEGEAREALCKEVGTTDNIMLDVLALFGRPDVKRILRERGVLGSKY